MVHILGGSRAAVKRADLFEILRVKGPIRPRKVESKQYLLQHVLDIVGSENITNQEKINIERTVDTFCKSLSARWSKAHGFLVRFKQQNNTWLQDKIITSGTDNAMPSGSASSTFGRPKVLFSEGSRQTKRRRVQSDVLLKSEEELYLAAELKLRASGKRDAAAMLHKITYSPNRATRLKRMEATKCDIRQMSFSAEEALAFFVSFKLTRHQYIGLRALVIKKSLNKLFPTYDKIIEAKKKCYPSDVTATNMLVEVPLQSLLDHTTCRVIETQKEVITTFNDNSNLTETQLQMIYKWGSDGSGSQSNYKQRCEGDDSTILTTSLVPLQLYFEDGKATSNKVVLWQNPRTSSTRFCRPIRIQFIKETDEVIKSEFSYIEDQIRQLSPTKISLNDREYVVNHTMLKTMVDGKVCNSLMSTSSQKCYICKAGPAQFNDLEYIKAATCDTAALNLGLSTLHAYIRFFECLLHVSYRLGFKVWRVPKNHKDEFNNRKQNIILKFREETGLLIDVPKPGFGNTNDGNTARRFFADPVLTSSITGLDSNLINRFSVILKTLNCSYQVNSTRFGQYAYETAQLYVELYKWYPMPPTVHKILMHSKEVINNFLLPIGQLGEDAQESRHKEVKYYREHNTRKITRKQTNEDLFNILLVSSDPIISTLRVLPRQGGVLEKDVIDLLESDQ